MNLPVFVLVIIAISSIKILYLETTFKSVTFVQLLEQFKASLDFLSFFLSFFLFFSLFVFERTDPIIGMFAE